MNHNHSAWQESTLPVDILMLKRLAAMPDDSAVKFTHFALQRSKILGLIWFDGDLPDDPDQPFDYALRTDRGDEEELPESWINISRLDIETRMWICRRLERPSWVDDPSTLHGKWTCNEFLSMWKNFRGELEHLLRARLS